MSDYIPTLEEVRGVWTSQGNIYSPEAELAYGEEFDRWLTQHDAEIVKQTEERIIALLESTKCECLKDKAPLVEKDKEYFLTHANCGFKEIIIDYHIALINGETK